ncbi:MAG: stalk domain-containing protein [Deinococcales bacterium]
MKFFVVMRGAFAILLFLSAFALAQTNQPSRPTTRIVTRQLVWPLETNFGFLNGMRVQFSTSARTVDGRTVLPLRELSRVLGVPLETVREVPDGLRFGKLELYPNLRLARLNGRQVPLAEVATTLDGSLFVVARILDQALNATVVFDMVQRLITITISRDVNPDANLPVARFATDKKEYKIGEPVRIIKYSYDPTGIPITLERFSGREDAYFTSGLKSIALVVTNRNGLVSEPYVVNIRVTNEVLYTPREFGLRFVPVGRTFSDTEILSYPQAQIRREDEAVPLIFSDSPENPDRSGLLYEEVVGGTARLMAYHTNGMASSGRLLVWASNLEPTPVSLKVSRFGATSATAVVATLGRASLLDFLTSSGLETITIEPSRGVPVYLSNPLDSGEGLNLMFDLETNGRVQVSVYFLEEALITPSLSNLASELLLSALRSLPVLPRDGVHQRGTFYGAIRRISIDLAQIPQNGAIRQIVGDGNYDPSLIGRDALAGEQMNLKGNFGATYLITLENARGTVGALVPRGGPYAGAMKINGVYTALPDSGTLYRNDLPVVVYRSTDQERIELEIVPASGSFLPINFIYYRPEARVLAN